MATNDPFGDLRRRRGSLFDEFFSDFFDRPFGADPGTRPPGVRTAAPAARRPVEQVDITDFFSDATRALLQRAAQRALEWNAGQSQQAYVLGPAAPEWLRERVNEPVNGKAR
jgi:hypothetical protein